MFIPPWNSNPSTADQTPISVPGYPGDPGWEALPGKGVINLHAPTISLSMEGFLMETPAGNGQWPIQPTIRPDTAVFTDNSYRPIFGYTKLHWVTFSACRVVRCPGSVNRDTLRLGIYDCSGPSPSAMPVTSCLVPIPPSLIKDNQVALPHDPVLIGIKLQIPLTLPVIWGVRIMPDPGAPAFTTVAHIQLGVSQ